MAILNTNVDKLMDFINLRHGCTVEDASRALSVPHKRVEQIAETLQKSNLIEIKYSFTGIRLTPKKPNGNGHSGAGSSLALATDAPSTIRRIEAIRDELLQAQNLIVFSEKEIRNKMARAKVHFEQIKNDEISFEAARLSMGRMRDLEISLRSLEERADSLGKAAFEIRQHMGGLEGMLEIRASNGDRGGISDKVFQRIFFRA